MESLSKFVSRALSPHTSHEISPRWVASMYATAVQQSNSLAATSTKGKERVLKAPSTWPQVIRTSHKQITEVRYATHRQRDVGDDTLLFPGFPGWKARQLALDRECNWVKLTRHACTTIAGSVAQRIPQEIHPVFVYDRRFFFTFVLFGTFVYT